MTRFMEFMGGWQPVLASEALTYLMDPCDLNTMDHPTPLPLLAVHLHFCNLSCFCLALAKLFES